MSEALDLLFPLDLFYRSAGAELPHLRLVPGEDVPEPYRSLLVHQRDLERVRATDQLKTQARSAAEEALAEPLEVFRSYFIRDGFIGDGEGPSIADIRLACTLEFLSTNDAPLPKWAQDYLARVEKALGKA